MRWSGKDHGFGETIVHGYTRFVPCEINHHLLSLGNGKSQTENCTGLPDCNILRDSGKIRNRELSGIRHIP